MRAAESRRQQGHSPGWWEAQVVTEPGQSAFLIHGWLHPSGLGPWEANHGDISKTWL